ncbi:MAG: translesion error-prone DNA polymerase V autoproteolytic subunit [Prolixibacteraceae bacterium]|jgi:DNA polymerase V|nr:translesion error-prone DNA polymerase V autoproteolytic subunit [Prolixibacteraceae bacterium]MBT6764297.1 translesion error-prone DNA polymerase V autoproteolytic subunit [Prolixibacteraceae bacterium]MBT7000930.1 translesion error-prone DNA polymerase V autoproteolytic subunit [Prolixibacteraceae bacterium]MBT7397325.1 translesion error-prone DNA polymerase V autoproteolytic subunit [Prolixibacteraceae bacterium]
MQQRSNKYSKLTLFKPSFEKEIDLPFIEANISAGFPSPAEDYLEARIDLNKELIINKSATFYARVKGESMNLAGISDGDLLIIDKSKTPVSGSIVVCLIDGEFTLKRLEKQGNIFYLMPENPDYKPIKIKPENDVTIWGVVTYTIKKHI